MSIARFDDSYAANPAENYERFFVPSIGAPLARELIGRVDVDPTDRVVDVACGTGIVIRLLPPATGEGSREGLDPNPAMLAVAKAVPSADHVKWHQAAAEAMALPSESFDLVLCQMGVQFMTDRVAAVQEMSRVLKPGGRILLSVPGPLAGIFTLLASALERHVGASAAGFVNQVFSLHDVGTVEHLLREAGLGDVRVESVDHHLRLPAPQAFLWQYLHSTPLIGVVSQASPDAISAMEREVLDSWAAFVREEVLEHGLRLVVASGTKVPA